MVKLFFNRKGKRMTYCGNAILFGRKSAQILKKEFDREAVCNKNFFENQNKIL